MGIEGLKAQIEADDLLFDQAIYRHGYTASMRDYDVHVQVMAANPKAVPHTDARSYTEGLYRYRFTRCPQLEIKSNVPAGGWRDGWDDLFLNYESWSEAGEPGGYLWAVEYALAYPGLSYVEDSPTASSWAEQFGHDMHEVRLETNVFDLRLICHSLETEQTAWGDPETRRLVDEDGREVADG